MGHHSFCPRREGQALSGKKWYPSRSVRCVSSSINASSGDGSSTDSECVVDELVDDIDDPHVDRRTWEAEAVSPDCCDMSVQGLIKNKCGSLSNLIPVIVAVSWRYQHGGNRTLNQTKTGNHHFKTTTLQLLNLHT